MEGAMPQPQEQSAPSRARILVVDDEAMIRKALKRILERGGYDVFLAEDGTRAAEALAARDFDLVLTDVNMPDMDGLSVLRAVRSRDPDLPVILFTAQPSTDTAIGAVELHATGYLRKPMEPSLVLSEVDKALTLHQLAVARREAHALVSQQHDSSGRDQLSASFDRALEKLFMVYQPIVRWPQREVFGYEALVRSAEPDLPHPGALFDAAEKLERVPELGATIRRLCARVLPELDPRASLFVNLHSAELLDDGLYDAAAPLSQVAERVVLEITERAHLSVVGDVEARIGRLREAGFRIAIDDIGAGYSGLNSFAMLRPDLVKLDMALVRAIDRDPVRQRVTGMLTDLCRDLGIGVVGEGVETAAERETLAGLGCELFQGYLFAKPAPPFIEPDFDA